MTVFDMSVKAMVQIHGPNGVMNVELVLQLAQSEDASVAMVALAKLSVGDYSPNKGEFQPDTSLGEYYVQTGLAVFEPQSGPMGEAAAEMVRNLVSKLKAPQYNLLATFILSDADCAKLKSLGIEESYSVRFFSKGMASEEAFAYQFSKYLLENEEVQYNAFVHLMVQVASRDPILQQGLQDFAEQMLDAITDVVLNFATKMVQEYGQDALESTEPTPKKLH